MHFSPAGMVKTKDNLTDVSDSVMSEKCYFDNWFWWV